MIKVGIVGGTGYTGVELLRILSQHPHARITAITSRKEAGLPVADMFPSLRGRVDLAFTTPDEAKLHECDVVFFATPHGVAMAQARELLAAGVKIIDLAADFRLKDTAEFEKWYGMPHACPDILAEAVYGLPELNREAIRKARVIGNPGCYPTSVQLGFAPLLRTPGLVDAGHLIANCASGVSGAGRKAEVHTLLAEASDNFKAYGVKGHRHGPEINQQLRAIAGGDGSVHCVFVPHLIPAIRGIHSTLYARLTPQGQQTDLQKLYEDAYRGEPFVDVMPAGSAPETRSVRASNVVRIAVHRPAADLAMVLVVEDNLTKGASGQAVQCMNLMFGLEETAGLNFVPVLP
ncbi:N-acetyl-gamma-glutamyl-phosphate reductase [Caldimonas thermodepolymerans]|jgi:N-acetyl-gamma-glutamyl-phosphate reductase, common form|uniref:N-acetyl-gamma-glutamyl-phosphate reductase n=1 Tax=Caldimonas thermodepolymerans TaxID=215580 RepID=A0A2S5T6B0_9BURK|nr:N-acetyl-gamma-glutamyl-phosphate reductase [Caldimonas thermodepolymerans]PPE70479.1 N-acetyl-gamma-glutamyl-phosphate reductase [Caldimonas thermodepolymerans]QPC31146.1 N-acetyl-gamma-glutamyl-phosphate reductase [Caldimonas thermodepolymerans]RDH96603.1 N-acetyl-gamma-glutamyl-phosphate reductase [Caldimonas thermodepolymerans]TCP04798.1 N-acetyl-gamma-glutamyl-phosphate reductase [Caldimonas thermodepolymerans]UZG43876.1 N-acetyl-gamma-glutamyl-phosphate reductase [Caldimonas thermodep